REPVNVTDSPSRRKRDHRASRIGKGASARPRRNPVNLGAPEEQDRKTKTNHATTAPVSRSGRQQPHARVQIVIQTAASWRPHAAPTPSSSRRVPHRDPAQPWAAPVRRGRSRLDPRIIPQHAPRCKSFLYLPRSLPPCPPCSYP